MNGAEIYAEVLANADVPTLPEVVARILEVCDSPLASANDLMQLVQRDPAISSKVLGLANSCFLGHQRSVTHMAEAVALLEFDTVRALAVSSRYLSDMEFNGLRLFEPRDYWMHSLGTARAAEFLAGASLGKSSAGACYTAGLLHDMGKYELALTYPSTYSTLIQEAAIAQRPLHEVERESWNLTHADVCAYLLDQWKLPESVSVPIRNIYRAENYVGPYARETRILALSNHLSCAAGFGTACEHCRVDVPFDLLERDGVSVGLVREVLTTLEWLQGEAPNVLALMQVA